MLYMYATIFIILGLTQIFNFISIFIRKKSFMSLPQVTKTILQIDTLKYQAYTQITSGFLFILYGMAVLRFNVTNLMSHLLFALISIVSVCIIGHLQYLFE